MSNPIVATTAVGGALAGAATTGGTLATVTGATATGIATTTGGVGITTLATTAGAATSVAIAPVVAVVAAPVAVGAFVCWLLRD